MDKNTAANLLANANIDTYDIAHSIYLATVQGISGANQNDGMGFHLSAIAELWNIRGTVGNPNAKTKITGRYKGMGVTEDMIFDVVSQYPNGLRGSTPLFDNLLESSAGQQTQRASQTVYESPKMPEYERNYTEAVLNREAKFMLLGFVLGFIVCKFVLHFGWIASIVLGFIVGCVFLVFAVKQ